MRRAAKFTVIGSTGIMLVALIAAMASAVDVPVIAGVQESVLAATCKVSTSGQATSSQQCAATDCTTGKCPTAQPAGSVGTGFAFFKSDDYVWVMTNRHVVGANSQGKTVYTTWWRSGRQSRKLPMVLVAVSKVYDIAIGQIKIALFKGRLPRIIPLAEAVPVATGETILTAGCPSGDWSTATKGHVTKPLTTPAGIYTSFRYLPSPRNGRSGSPIFNAAGTRVIGLCYLRTAGQGQAYGTPVLRSVFPRRSVLIDGHPRFLFQLKREGGHGGCQPQPQPTPAEEGIYPGLPNIDVAVQVEPEAEVVEPVGWVAPLVVCIVTLVIGIVVLLGRQLFGKLGK